MVGAQDSTSPQKLTPRTITITITIDILLISRARGRAELGGTKDCTPEIDTSEIIVDFQQHFPMDFQWYFPTHVHVSVVFSKELKLFQWILQL